MVDRDVFLSRLSRLEELIGHLERLREGGREHYFGSVTNRASAERWLQLAGECALDLANHAISDAHLRVPLTYRESFDVLAEGGLIPADLASDMKGWAGLRNVLVHMYLTIDHEILWTIITDELPTIRRFSQAMARLIT